MLLSTQIYLEKQEKIPLDKKYSSNLIDVTVEFTSSADNNEHIPDSPILFLTK